MVRSLADQAEQSGAWPRWSLHQTKPNFMSGDPAVATVADAACRGLLATGEVRELYRSLQTLTDQQRDPDYLAKGYVPREKAGKAASDTLENAHADAAMAMLADRLGRAGGHRPVHGARATNGWQTLLDPETRYLRPRNADGSFPPDYDPSSDQGWKEGQRPPVPVAGPARRRARSSKDWAAATSSARAWTTSSTTRPPLRPPAPCRAPTRR
jgi:putative alpha-1,2-mannosidase